MSYPTPILRIEIEGITQTIVQHLGTSHREIAGLVEEELRSLDLPALIRDEVAVQGRHIVKKAVADAADALARSITHRLIEDLRDEIEKIGARGTVTNREETP